jgi:hypothetical protein
MMNCVGFGSGGDLILNHSPHVCLEGQRRTTKKHGQVGRTLDGKSEVYELISKTT